MALSYLYRYGATTFHSQVFHRGYLDPFDYSYQIFYRDLYLTLGKFKIKLKRKKLFREEVPQHAVIQGATSGHTEWRSACPPDLFEKCYHRVEEAA